MHEPTATGILGIQRAVAVASPSAWRDGIVIDADDRGIVVATLAGEVLRLASAPTTRIGDPVAFHPVAQILAAGGVWQPARRIG